MKKGDYSISGIYQGGYSSLDPYKNISPSAGPLSAGDIGMSTDARTANVVKEITKNLSAGAKVVELTQVSPQVFDSIPDYQLDEVRRQAKLIGAEVTLHAPVVEPSGITQQGFTETEREAVERQMTQAVKRAQRIRPDGNIPVTFHSSAMVPGEMSSKNGKPDEIMIINEFTGEISKMPLKEHLFPGEENGRDIQKEIERRNKEVWSNQITNLGYATNRAVELIKIGTTEEKIQEPGALTPNYDIGKSYLEDSYRQLKLLYDIASEYGKKEDKKILDELYNKIEDKAKKIKKNPKDENNINLMKSIVLDGVQALGKISSPPKLFKPLTEFAEEKTTETFANVALNTYNEFVKKGKKAPIISIENPPAGGAFSTGEELKKIIEKSREKFAQKLTKEGVSKSEAEKQAEKLIGATWDVGHINMLRKYGYTDEDIIKHSEEIAPLVKHVHLSDNFGMEHTELPMGMGNVPIKQIMEKLGEKGYKGKKIIEALNWWQHFSEQRKVPPLVPTLEAFGSPIYTEGVGGPYWNQTVGLQQGYFAGYGAMLPQINYQTFGAGFSQLPTELGGQMPGAQGSRLSGKPME